MVKVKLFECSYIELDDYNSRELLKGITTWEDCSEEEYAYLKEHSGFVVVRLIETEEFKTTLAKCIATAKKKHAEQEALQEKYKKDLAVREQRKLERQLKKATALLEKHKDKNG